MAENKLDSREIQKLQEVILVYLETEPSITNRGLRQLTGINYDQAIYLFNHMLALGTLIRVGRNSGTKYILS